MIYDLEIGDEGVLSKSYLFYLKLFYFLLSSEKRKMTLRLKVFHGTPSTLSLKDSIDVKIMGLEASNHKSTIER